MRIQDLLAQRAPFLLIDRIESLRIGEFIAAIKTVSINESFLRSNESIPDYMPNAIMLEALVQAASALVLSEDEHKGEVPVLESVSKARFLKEAIPDSLEQHHFRIDYQDSIFCMNKSKLK